MELYNVILILLVIGAVTGFLAGLFGIGGGTVLIPVFLTIFPWIGIEHDRLMHIAVATSLALILPTAITSSMTHFRLGHIDMHIVKKWVPGLIVGIIIGSIAIHFVPTYVLKVAFTCYLLLCFIFTFVKSECTECDDGGPPKLISAISSFFVGGFSTLLGIGGGTFTVPILIYFKYPLKKAIGISALTGFFIGLIGATVIMIGSYHVPDLPKYSIGYVNFLVFAAVAPTAILTSPLGTRCTEMFNDKHLMVIYTLFLLCVFLLMLYHLGIYPS
jgi:uncharacterized protein